MTQTRADAAWQTVTCCGCGRSYRCTPSSDYYNNTTLEDGVCERCLLDESKPKGAAPPDPGYISPLLQKLLDAGLVVTDEEPIGRETRARAVEHDDPRPLTPWEDV